MVLTDYTFRLGDGGIVLNTDSSSFPFVDIDEVRGLDSAPFRETTRDHEGVDGGFLDAEFEKARPIILEGTIYDDPNNLENFLNILKANYAPSTVLVPFYFKAPNSDEKILFVKPQGVRYDWDSDRRLGVTRAQFLVYAEDPRIYTNVENNVTIPLGGFATEGFGFPLSFPFAFGTTLETGTAVTLTNSGNRSTPVEFTIFGPSSEPSIINETLGKALSFDLDIATTENLVVNTYYRTVRLNGVINRRNALRDPNWFDLEQGDTTIRFQEAGVVTVFEETPLNPNPFFETDVSGWVASTGGTISRSTAQAHEGVASLLFVPDGVTATTGFHTNNIATITPGRLYKARSWVRQNQSRTFNLQIMWFRSNQTFISLSTMGTTPAANTWTLIELVATAPAEAEIAWIQYDIFGTPPNTYNLFVDESMLQTTKKAHLVARYRSAWR